MPVIKFIDQIPEHLFNDALSEVPNMDWDSARDGRRKLELFKTSQAIHLRIDETTPVDPKTGIPIFSTVKCVDAMNRPNFPKVDNLISWIYERVSGKTLGRIFLVNLLPGGTVGNHKDIGQYFQSYQRFHVPLVTNTNVVFTGDGTESHMEAGKLWQLNNRNVHGVLNRSELPRIHIIVDIETDDNEFQFT
jgi:hypothetical protein